VLKLTYSNLEFQNFPGRTPGPPLQGEGREGEGRGGEGGEREREGKDRGGKEGGRGGMGVVGRGGALDMGSAPPRDKLWIRPLVKT